MEGSRIGQLRVEEIAKICHEVNRAYCAAIGDDSQVPWGEAPAWQKVSVVTGVKFVIDNLFAGAEKQHNSWMSQKLRDGWQYGPRKDGQARIHPCLLPYDELPREQKLKSDLFRVIVRGLMPDMNETTDDTPELPTGSSRPEGGGLKPPTKTDS